jgi:RNA polymerase sigma-70 factor (sigma-E family)
MQGTDEFAGRVPAPPPAETWPDSMLAHFRDTRLEMVRLAFLITGSNAVAEEVVQEAFVRARPAWAHIENPGGYVRNTVVNLARGHVRRRRLERHHTASTRPDTVTVGDPHVDETWAAVCRLPERQRAVLALRFYEDLSVQQIADVLGLRPGTVKSTLHRAIARLRKELS